MKHLQHLVAAIVIGLGSAGGWAFAEYSLGLGPVPAWYAGGIAAAATFWVSQYALP